MASLRGKSVQVLLLLLLLGAIASVACTETQEDALIEAATKVSVELDDVLVNAPQLAFAGKVTSPDGGKWLNDYVAIVYKDGQEVGRDVSKLGEFPESDEGKHDGLFFVKIENVYNLTAGDIVPPYPDMAFQDGRGVVGVKYIYSWLGEVSPGHQVSVQVPSKRIAYTLVIIPQPISELPTEFQAGKTELTADNKIIARATDGTPLALPLGTPPPPPPPPVVEPQPAGPGGLSWTRQISGFSGNRWDAWMQYVDGRVVGISWEAFKEETLRYNPDLEADGYVFQSNKTYLFPEN